MQTFLRDCLQSVLGHPDAGPGREPPLVAYDARRVPLNDVDALAPPDHSVVISVHNTGRTLGAVLDAVVMTTRGRWELIIVTDGCVDDSLKRALEAVKRAVAQTTTTDCSHAAFVAAAGADFGSTSPLGIPANVTKQVAPLYGVCEAITNEVAANIAASAASDAGGGRRLGTNDATSPAAVAAGLGTRPGWASCGTLTRVVVLQQMTGVWEASSNNLGMCMAHAESQYFHVVQDDQLMTQIGWNVHLTLPLMIYDEDAFSVSARCAHNYDLHDHASEYAGRCGGHIEDLWHASFAATNYSVRDTSNRGPLTLVAQRMLSMGKFNEHDYLLGFDDHDLHARAYAANKWVTGNYGTAFFAPLPWGAQRDATINRAKQMRPPGVAMNNMTSAAESEFKRYREHRGRASQRISSVHIGYGEGEHHDEERPMPLEDVKRVALARGLCVERYAKEEVPEYQTR